MILEVTVIVLRPIVLWMMTVMRSQIVLMLLKRCVPLQTVIMMV